MNFMLTERTDKTYCVKLGFEALGICGIWSYM